MKVIDKKTVVGPDGKLWVELTYDQPFKTKIFRGDNPDVILPLTGETFTIKVKLKNDPK